MKTKREKEFLSYTLFTFNFNFILAGFYCERKSTHLELLAYPLRGEKDSKGGLCDILPLSLCNLRTSDLGCLFSPTTGFSGRRRQGG